MIDTKREVTQILSHFRHYVKSPDKLFLPKAQIIFLYEDLNFIFRTIVQDDEAE